MLSSESVTTSRSLVQFNVTTNMIPSSRQVIDHVPLRNNTATGHKDRGRRWQGRRQRRVEQRAEQRLEQYLRRSQRGYQRCRQEQRREQQSIERQQQ